MPHPSVFLMILAFALLLGPLVLLHELGHYWVARFLGVKADAFSIGFGRELMGWTDRRGTRWKISALPLGGYVQFAGDMNETSLPAADLAQMSAEDRRHCFQFRPLWQRGLIVLAGPLANFLVAVVIFAAYNMAFGRIEAAPVIDRFADPSPARAAGMLPGDRILAIDGNAIASFDDIRQYVLPNPGDTLEVLAERDHRRLTFHITIATRTVKDEFGNESHIGQIGIGSGRPQLVRAGPGEAVSLAFGQCFSMVHTMVGGIRQILVGTRSVKELGGPVKIAQYSSERLTMGWLEFVYFAGLISINLAFINLLPIPALDGGHLVFYAAEAVRGKPLGARSHEWAFRTGMALVLALMLFVTLNDLASLHLFGG